MTIAQGTNKEVRIKRQGAKGTLAGTSDGQILRRESANFVLAKENYTTESEITSTQQVKSNRHGPKTVNGSLSGLLSPGTYADPISAVLRRNFTAVVALTGLELDISGAGPDYTITRDTGSFLSGGIKIGMVVRITAGTFDPDNLNKNLFVIGVTALTLTVRTLNGSVLVEETGITGATITVPGKVTYVPTSGHTNVYYTVEEWYPDAAVSERNSDVKFVQADLSLPGSGNATISLSALGLDQTRDSTAYFTSPSPESTSEVVAAANGLLIIDGESQAVVTSLSIAINGNGAVADGVVGSNKRPDVFRGKVAVSGSLTAYFEGGPLDDSYLEEANVTILSALTTSDAPDADFITFAITRSKLNSADPDDGETGLKRTYNFMSTLDSSGGSGNATEATSIQIHDSVAA